MVFIIKLAHNNPSFPFLVSGSCPLSGFPDARGEGCRLTLQLIGCGETRYASLISGVSYSSCYMFCDYCDDFAMTLIAPVICFVIIVMIL